MFVSLSQSRNNLKCQKLKKIQFVLNKTPTKKPKIFKLEKNSEMGERERERLQSKFGGWWRNKTFDVSNTQHISTGANTSAQGALRFCYWAEINKMIKKKSRDPLLFEGKKCGLAKKIIDTLWLDTRRGEMMRVLITPQLLDLLTNGSGVGHTPPHGRPSPRNRRRGSDRPPGPGQQRGLWEEGEGVGGTMWSWISTSPLTGGGRNDGGPIQPPHKCRLPERGWDK